MKYITIIILSTIIWMLIILVVFIEGSTLIIIHIISSTSLIIMAPEWALPHPVPILIKRIEFIATMCWYKISRWGTNADAGEHVFDARPDLHAMPEEFIGAGAIRVAFLVAPFAHQIISGRTGILIGWPNLIYGHGAFDSGRFTRHPAVVTELNDILQHETYARRQLHIISEHLHPLKILIHQLLPFVCVQYASARTQYLAQAFQILRHVLRCIAASAFIHQQLLDALVQYGLREDFQLGQFTDELDVTQHFPFRQLPAFFVFRCDDAVAMVTFECLACLWPILKFGFALVEQQQTERARLVVGLKVWCFFGQPSAQLCVHRRVFRFIECFVEYQQNHTF